MKEIIEIIDSFNNSPLRFLKRNLNLIIILPTILGGLWQIIELSQMSFSFIRFFSVGQIIPDGLLILMLLIIFFLSAMILVYYWKKIDSDVEENEMVSKKSNIRYSILFLILFLGCVPLIIYTNNYFINNIESMISLFFYMPVNIIFILFSLLFIHNAILFCPDNRMRFYKTILNNIRPLTFYIQIFMLFPFMAKFHDVFMLPIELKNVDNLICKIEKIDENANFEIRYSNDKYVFIECHKFTKDRNGKHKQSEIRILKFEDLLDDTACIGNKRIEQNRIKDSIRDSKIGLLK